MAEIAFPQPQTLVLRRQLADAGEDPLKLRALVLSIIAEHEADTNASAAKRQRSRRTDAIGQLLLFPQPVKQVKRLPFRRRVAATSSRS